MKKFGKITLSSLAVIIAILSGVLTIMEKTITIVDRMKPKTQASSVPEGTVTEKGLAVGIKKDEVKTTAKASK